MLSPSFYADRAKHFFNEAKKSEKRVTQYATIRLLLAGAGIASYFIFPLTIFFVALLCILTAFVIFMRKQIAIERQKKILTHLYELNLKEEKSLLYKGSDFPDGSAFKDAAHPYSHDLDLFGDGSIFQYLNRCATWMGESWLAYDLKNIRKADHSAENLVLRQQAVQELGPMTDFRQYAWATGQLIDDGPLNHRSLRDWLNAEPFLIHQPVVEVVRKVLPFITLMALALTIYNTSFIPYLLMLLGIQTSIASSFSRKIKAFQKQLDHVNKILENYSHLFKALTDQKVHSALMKKHAETATAAHAEVKRFSSLVNALESRMNFISMIFGNAFFLYDLQNVSKLERWRQAHGASLPGWLDSLAEWDSLLSLANLHANFPEYAFAKKASENKLEIKNAGHLLIPIEKRVDNSVSIGDPQNVWLITGANMAGKSTFLRAIGVNFVLGSIGSPVCASYWSMPLIDLQTGMRTTDSLQENQSYFFAELNRLQAIMHELRTGKPMLILLDEILKGTNSTDKQLGSRELLRQLKDMNALVVLATHDIALGDLHQEYPEQIENACFEGEIIDDTLTFDYTLHAGVAKKANATFLMRKMGIIPAL